MSDVAAKPEVVERIPAHSWYALGVLTMVYVLNFLDRALVFILLSPIQKEFQFSGFQLGLLGSASFAIFYTLLDIPFGRMADRMKRKWLIAAGLAVWSLFSGLTGFAGGFWSLFLCRLMVGVGEATLGPAALSLREAQRGQTEGATAPGYTSRDWKVLFKTSALRYHYAGYALFGLA
jgi:MFS family permease